MGLSSLTFIGFLAVMSFIVTASKVSQGFSQAAEEYLGFQDGAKAPIVTLSILDPSGSKVNSVGIGERLVLRATIKERPSVVYDAFIRNCRVKTDDGDSEYVVTDEVGCAVDTTVFDEWQFNLEKNVLEAQFDAFKFPSSDNVRFQCTVKVCPDKCERVGCPKSGKFNGSPNRTVRQILLDQQNVTALTDNIREEVVVRSNPVWITRS